jgi:hypothetical protein
MHEEEIPSMKSEKPEQEKNAALVVLAKQYTPLSKGHEALEGWSLLVQNGDEQQWVRVSQEDFDANSVGEKASAGVKEKIREFAEKKKGDV